MREVSPSVSIVNEENDNSEQPSLLIDDQTKEEPYSGLIESPRKQVRQQQDEEEDCSETDNVPDLINDYQEQPIPPLFSEED